MRPSYLHPYAHQIPFTHSASPRVEGLLPNASSSEANFADFMPCEDPADEFLCELINQGKLDCEGWATESLLAKNRQHLTLKERDYDELYQLLIQPIISDAIPLGSLNMLDSLLAIFGDEIGKEIHIYYAGDHVADLLLNYRQDFLNWLKEEASLKETKRLDKTAKKHVLFFKLSLKIRTWID